MFTSLPHTHTHTVICTFEENIREKYGSKKIFWRSSPGHTLFICHLYVQVLLVYGRCIPRASMMEWFDDVEVRAEIRRWERGTFTKHRSQRRGSRSSSLPLNLKKGSPIFPILCTEPREGIRHSICILHA